MANIAKITDATGSTKYLLLKDSNKVFLQSKNINVFPCSRRGLYKVLGQDQELSLVKQYDPEARLNTERTNRLHTAVNGFKDSFIESFENNTLKFILAGYWVEVKNFDPAKIAEQLDTTANIYAHLRLHTGVSLDAEGYYTEILANQFSEQAAEKYLDISYTASDNTSDFFVGISFVSSQTSEENAYTLHLFSKPGSDWLPVQTSLLPKIEHDTTEDSIKVSGDFTIVHDSEAEFKVTDANATLNVPTAINNTLAVTKPASVTGVAATISGGLTVSTGDVTVTDGALTVSKGDTTLQKLDAGATTLDSLAVNENVLIVDDGVNITGETQITGNLNVAAGKSTSTPTLKVNTITSNTTTVITVQQPLDITSTNQTKIAGAVIIDNTLTADNIKVDSDGTLDVKTITNTKSGDTAITVNKGLDITGTVKVDTITNKSANTDGSAKAIAVGAPLEITWPTPATDNAISLKVANGATTLRKLEATELKVATDKLTVTSTTASFNVPVTVNSSLEATTSVKTPALDVKTIENKVDNTGVSINDPLNITTGHAVATDTLNVDTINSRTTNGTITVESPVKVDNTLEVVNDATLKSNLEVEDNINVGSLTDAEKATTDNGGYIVAKKDITAIQNLIAKQNVSAGGSGAIAGSLTVGTDNNADTGTINAKKLVKAPTLEATNQLNVKSGITASPAKANIDEANIINTTITGALTVHNTSNNAKITADKVQIDKDLIVYDTITATKDLGATKNNLNVNKASITTAAIGTINSDDINQKIDNSYYDVPVMFVQQQDSADSNVYQLQIRRATVLQYKAN